jgi:deazaflavin-dependent oxidoreductase (nitroreductase family)
MSEDVHYKRPGWVTRNVMNKLVMALSGTGLSLSGSRVLEVKGRKSGEPRRTPVNLLELDGNEYLVSPRGETEWVKNVRASGGDLDLILGRKRRAFKATELDGKEKVAVLRGYLKKWKFETGMFFDGVGPDSSDEKFLAVAQNHPAFSLAPSS